MKQGYKEKAIIYYMDIKRVNFSKKKVFLVLKLIYVMAKLTYLFNYFLLSFGNKPLSRLLEYTLNIN